jgi:hypothetical protein
MQELMKEESEMKEMFEDQIQRMESRIEKERQENKLISSNNEQLAIMLNET